MIYLCGLILIGEVSVLTKILQIWSFKTLLNLFCDNDLPVFVHLTVADCEFIDI